MSKELEDVKKLLEEAEADKHEMKIQISDLMTEIKHIKELFQSETIPKAEKSATEMDSLQGFNPKDMVNPTPYNMEPGSFHNWNELFTSYMMCMDKKWQRIWTRRRSMKSRHV